MVAEPKQLHRWYHKNHKHVITVLLFPEWWDSNILKGVGFLTFGRSMQAAAWAQMDYVIVTAANVNFSMQVGYPKKVTVLVTKNTQRI